MDEGHFRSERWPTAPVLCRAHGPLDYWAGLNRYWRSGAMIINVEHDIEVTDSHVRALLDCPHPLCSWVYRLHWCSTGLADGTLSVRAENDLPVMPDAEWAAWSAIGLVKIAPQARTGPLRPEPWQRVELAVNDAVRGPWHVHWPEVNHHHW